MLVPHTSLSAWLLTLDSRCPKAVHLQGSPALVAESFARFPSVELLRWREGMAVGPRKDTIKTYLSPNVYGKGHPVNLPQKTEVYF